jgi:hypothetical protein
MIMARMNPFEQAAGGGATPSPFPPDFQPRDDQGPADEDIIRMAEFHADMDFGARDCEASAFEKGLFH